jgi:lipid A 3-O-deacylase
MKPLLLMAAFAMQYGEGCLLNAQALYDRHSLSDSNQHLLRIYEDDDFINIRGCGTDDAYTNGSRVDYFYVPKHRPRGFIAHIIPRAGDSSIDVYGWGLMQLMYTPDNISSTAYQPNDYPYSGALIAIHSIYSYNPVKKYDFQTELVAGILGPAALDQQSQTMVHHLIHYIRPMGWSHQFRDAPLLNINFTAEKQLASAGQTVEVIGGGQVYAGTMMNGLAIYPLIRIGMMNSYFRGFFSQFMSAGRNARQKKKWQAYLVLKPEGQLIFTEAVLQGGLFTTNPNLKNESPTKPPPPYHPIQSFVASVNYGAVVSSGDFSISFNQNTSSAMMKGLYSHEVGNISLYFGW